MHYLARALLLLACSLPIACAHADCQRAIEAMDGALTEIDKVYKAQAETDDPAELAAQLDEVSSEYKRQGEALAKVELTNEDNQLSIDNLSEHLTELASISGQVADTARALVDIKAADGPQREALSGALATLESACSEDRSACTFEFAKNMLSSAEDPGSELMALKMLREKANDAARGSEVAAIDEAAAAFITAADASIETATARVQANKAADDLRARQSVLLGEMDVTISVLRGVCE